MSTTIPNNVLQRTISENRRDQRRNTNNVLNSIEGILLEIYDGDNPGLDLPKVKSLRKKNKNRLIGFVETSTKERFYLFFRQSPGHIYSLYGDRNLLKGCRIRIYYYNQDVSQGEIEIINGTSDDELGETIISTTVWNIGGIF